MNELQNQQTIGISSDTPFISKVFFFFGLAVLTSAAGTWVGFNYLAEMYFSSSIFIYGLFAVELILVFTSRMWSQRRPINYLLFAVFAFITGLTLVPILAGVILEFGGPDLIIKALLATTLMFTATAVFGWVTNRNLSGMRGFLWVSLIGMVVVSVIGIFVPWNNTFEMIFSGFGVIVFSGYTMYDIQRIKVMPDASPIDAALMLFLDIFNLFIYILRLMSASRR
jgi:hypothetical protein